MNLRIPGPTPCPPEVLAAVGRQMINHRGSEFGILLRRVTELLREFFQTSGDILVLTGSGTGAMEACIVNTLSPGDRVLSLSNGVFGDRFADIAETHGAQVARLRFEWGTAVDIEEARRALAADASVKAVLVTHNETSTGVTNDLAAISALVREFDKLLIVDAISSIGSIDLPVDKWGCDVVATGSQKGWMVPPGVAMVSLSERAWQAVGAAKMPRFYWDFTKAKSYLERSQTPWTPAVSVFFGLAEGLEMMQREGLVNIFARHQRVAQRTRDGVKSLGLQLFANEDYASNTVTAVRVPEGVDAKGLLVSLRDEEGVELSGGQMTLEGKIFRIGHLGLVAEADIDAVIGALRNALPRAGFKGSPAAVTGNS